MRILVSLGLALSAAFPCVAAPVVTNSVSRVASVMAATNAPAAKSTSARIAADKLSRRQCEAVTKSGNRCKRHAVPGGKLCRQHQKVVDQL